MECCEYGTWCFTIIFKIVGSDQKKLNINFPRMLPLLYEFKVYDCSNSILRIIVRNF
jgi:hypothetical protein